METTNYIATFEVYHVAHFIAEFNWEASNVLLLYKDVICRVEVPIRLITPSALNWQVAKQRCLRVAHHYILDKVNVNKYAGDWSDQRRLVGLNWFSGANHQIFNLISPVPHGVCQIFIVEFLV